MYKRQILYDLTKSNSDFKVVILQPTIVYGPKGGWTKHATNMRLYSSVSLPKKGNMVCNCVYVDDVAKAISFLVETGQQKRYLELGGDETFTFKELISILLTEIKRKRLILKLPFFLARIMGATNDFFRLIFGELVPAFITLAQVKSLEHDNLVGRKSDKFSDFGIVPKKLKIVLPKIVGRFNQG